MCQFCFQAVLARLEAGEVLDFSHVASNLAPRAGTGETTEPQVAVAKSTPIAPPAEERYRVAMARQ